jgi:hypothetical protein
MFTMAHSWSDVNRYGTFSLSSSASRSSLSAHAVIRANNAFHCASVTGLAPVTWTTFADAVTAAPFDGGLLPKRRPDGLPLAPLMDSPFPRLI